jgi:hypothetical protein
VVLRGTQSPSGVIRRCSVSTPAKAQTRISVRASSHVFVQAADDAGLPDDPDLRAGLRAYMEWAVGEVLAYSAPEVHVEDGLPVPRWGWNGLE